MSHTDRHETPTATLPPYTGPTDPSPAPPARPPRRRGLASAAVTGVVLLCGASAAGGAAAYDAWFAEPSTVAASGDRAEPGDPVQPVATDASVEAVARTVLPSVVSIDVVGPAGAGSGSGIVLTEDGRILTNHHVVEGVGEGGTVTVSFHDGTTAEAEVLGTDPLTDTAVLQAEDVSGLTPATIGSSSGVRVGQAVVAVGSPFGLDSTVTSGIVSALDRPVNVGSDGRGNSTTYPAIQTDAAINPGNSGGPLVDMEGRVVGISSSIRTAGTNTLDASGGSIGLGFAIPIDEVMPIVDQIVAGETPTHARLGITVRDVGATGEATAARGAQVVAVSEGSTAEEAGLEPGDVITQLGDHRIAGADSLVATIRSYRPGDRVEVTWQRDGDEQKATLELDSDADLV
jgi:putative serine protease PepD